MTRIYLPLLHFGRCQVVYDASVIIVPPNLYKFFILVSKNWIGFLWEWCVNRASISCGVRWDTYP